YREVTSSGAKIAYAFDKERKKVAEKLGISTSTIDSWAEIMFSHEQTKIEDKLKASVFAEFDFPSWALERTLDEDIEYNYVPLTGLAEAANVEVPHTKAMVTLFGTIFGKNYWETGITLEKLGLQGLTKDGLIKFLEYGNA
ncbi:MAG: NAD/NADP octopine/nopaline dehydrogenase family protein, partial [Thermodesulfobacteriota bacterium]|nr:NAD/NADP octopine/nopaline dehydrogenase family protein [Thermodesulfobacteriota bacterium]